MRDPLTANRRTPLSGFEESTRSDWTAWVDVYRVSMVVLVAVGFGLRVWNLGAAPLWVDESFTAWAAKNFVEGHGFSDPVGASSPYRRGWLTTTLPISVLFAVLGPSEFAARLPSALVGTLAIVVAYRLGAQYHPQVGLLVALVAALDPFMLVWAREARMYVHLQLLYVLAVYLLFRWRSEDALRLRSRYLGGLLVVGGLGLGTHKAFLAFGGVFLLFVAFVLVRNAVVRGADPGRGPTSETVAIRAAALLAGGLVLAAGYIAVTGMPDVLSAPAPGQWPERGHRYYWEFFAETYPVLWVLAVAGLTYLLLGDDQDTLVAVAFLVPLLVASMTAQKAPRYVYHLLPLFFVAAVVPAVRVSHYTFVGIAERVTSGPRAESRRVALAMLLVFVVVVTPPAGAVAVIDQPNDPPFHPDRSEFDAGSAFVDEHREESAVIMSTRPELSMWYLGETDYFFRQHGIKHVREEGDRLVHTRTGTVVVTDRAALESVMAQDRPVWLVAGKKFHQGFTDPSMRRYVQEHFIRVHRPSWDNMEVYYWSPYLHQRSFRDAGSMGTTTGNAFVAAIEGEPYLALGRTVETTAHHGTQGTVLEGASTIRVDVRPGEPAVLRTRTYGAKDGKRYVTVRVSTDGEHWRVVSRNDDEGWATEQVVIPADEVDSSVLYVRFDGGTRGENRYGGLVDSVQVYSMTDWQREALAADRNASADLTPAETDGR